MNRILKATAALVVGVTLASQTGCGNEPPEDLQEMAGEAVKYGAVVVVAMMALYVVVGAPLAGIVFR